MTDIDDIADRYVDEFAGLDPCQAAVMSIAGNDSALTDYSPEGFAARADLARRTLADIETVQSAATGDDGRIAAAMLRERLEIELELHTAGVLDSYLGTIDSPVELMLVAVELLEQRDEVPADAIRARIRAFPGALAGLRESLTQARREGRVAARRQVARVAALCEQGAGYLAGLAARYDAADEVAVARAALADFAAFLTGELAPYAPERDALGRERYALETWRFLGARLDLEETYAWGWDELARIESEMKTAAAAISPGQPVPAVIAGLDADPAHRISVERFQPWIQELADRAIADLDGVHFDIPAPLRRIDCLIAPTDRGVCYLAPTEDLSRPGTVWWTLEKGAVDVPAWPVPSTMFHEGAPGHHFQAGGAVLDPGLNRYQRVATEQHPGHTEGWALYAERLMGELGYYAEPAHYLGLLAGSQQLRAARVILDIGMHLELPIPAGTGFHEGERWNPQLGAEFMKLHSAHDDFTISFEIDRYLGRPAQAIAYQVGERVWLDAREEARRAADGAFDLKEFHRRALGLGPMGLDLFRAELRELFGVG